MAKASLKTQNLALPARFDVNGLRPLVDQLRVCRGAPLMLDGSAVEWIGGLGLQVLLSANKTWLADQQAFGVVTPSPALQEACAVAGAASLTP